VAVSFTLWFVGQSRLMAARVPVDQLASALTLLSTLGRGIAGPLAGIAGGIFMVPLESFVQVRPASEQKGAVISAANFVAFGGMLLSGPAAVLLLNMTSPANSLLIIGISAVAVGGWLVKVLMKGNGRL